MNRYPRRRKIAARASEVDSEWVFGIHAVRILLAREPQRIRRLMVSESRQDARIGELLHVAQGAGVDIEPMDPAELGALLPSEVHQGIAALAEPQPLLDETGLRQRVQLLRRAPLLLMLDSVQDPRNLGACLRSADACGVDAVVIPARRAASLTPAAAKIACGAAATVPVARVTNLARVIRWAKSRSIWVVGTGEGAELPVYRANLTGPLMLVVGGEEGGMRRLTRDLCDQVVSLPMKGVVESLNVSVAAGVCLYEALRQRELAVPERCA